MKKYLATLGLVMVVGVIPLARPTPVMAQTVDVTALYALIQSLQNQLQALLNQLNQPSVPRGPSVVINNVSGPNSLSVDETGTWRVNVDAPAGTNLNYSVDWGDQKVIVAGAVKSENKIQTSATFTHAYTSPGTYTAKFIVDNGIVCIQAPCSTHSSAQASVTVVVGNTSIPVPLTVRTPNGGERWVLKSNHVISWSPNPHSDTVEAYLEKMIDGQFYTVGKVVPSAKGSIRWEGDVDRYGDLSAPGNGYYIRLVDTKTGQQDRSDRSFTLLPQDYIKVDLKVNGSDGPIEIPAGGTTVKLSWTSSNVDSCSYEVADQGGRGGFEPNRSDFEIFIKDPMNRDGMAVYMDCKGELGHRGDAVSIKSMTTRQTRINSFTASPNPRVVKSADNSSSLNVNTILSWSASGAGSCKLVGGRFTGEKDQTTTGSVTITPLYPTTYTLTCYAGANRSGQATSATYTVRTTSDVNNDGQVNAIDLQIVSNCISNTNCTAAQRVGADINKDASVNASDLEIIQLLIMPPQLGADSTNNQNQTATVLTSLRSLLTSISDWLGAR
ncbi:MAG: PKD domain-containing protein [Candidatus Vogelbacteria bacterium]|nr:PKD domain-containing protein [Candidatus Vogelbacteria bacterium]